MVKNTSNIYYIVDKYLNLWVFKYNDQRELIYEVYNNKKEQIHTAVLARECREDFILSQGENNDIHIVLVKMSGDVLYYFFNGQKWTSLNLFQLGQQKDFFHLLGLYTWENQTHIIYTLENPPNSNQWLIIDQYWENNKWNHLKIFQTTKNPAKLDYAGIQSGAGNIYFIFQWWDGNEHQIQLCQFNSTLGLWNRSTLTFKKGDKYSPAIWITDSGTLHTAWIHVENNNHYSLRYRRRSTSPRSVSNWEKEVILYESHVEISKTFFSVYQNKFTVLWLEANNLCYIQSDNEGLTWESTPCLIARTSNPLFIHYLSKNSDPKNKNLYIIRDDRDFKTYPVDISPNVREKDSLSPINAPKAENNISPPRDENLTSHYSFYPSSQARKNLNRPTPSAINHNTPIRHIPARSQSNKLPISIENLKNLNEITIKNLNEEKARHYLLVFKEYLMKLYEENNRLKKESINKKTPPPQREINFHPPYQDNSPRNNTGIQSIRDKLKNKVIEEENIKLKSEITEYRNVLQQMQRELNILKKEINNVESENNKLKNEVYKIKENSIAQRISNFFRGD